MHLTCPSPILSPDFSPLMGDSQQPSDLNPQASTPPVMRAMTS